MGEVLELLTPLIVILSSIKYLRKMFSGLLLIIVILQSSQVLELQTQLDERTEEV